MSIKTKSIGALFVALIIILVVNPRMVNNMYTSILGRLFLVCVVVFFAMHNTTLGLLGALIIITSLNQFGSFVEATLPIIEGMTDVTPRTVGEDNTSTTGGQTVLTNSASESVKKKISELKQDIADGIDKEDIKAAIMSKDSNQIPVAKNMNSSSEVSASSSGMLNSSATLEGFSSFASV
jgi:hypothetical protein